MIKYDRDLMITMKHIRQARQCSHGARQFFANHKLDWSTFLKGGVPAGALIDTGDVMALAVVECAHGR